VPDQPRPRHPTLRSRPPAGRPAATTGFPPLRRPRWDSCPGLREEVFVCTQRAVGTQTTCP